MSTPAPAPPASATKAAAYSGRPGQGTAPDNRPRQLEMAMTLRQGARSATASLAAGPTRIFCGTAQQVSQVRQFVRSELAGHPALSDAVVVASELAANAVAHTASGSDDGLFLVSLARLGPQHIAVLVTDQGSPGQPHAWHARPDDESGRGLAIVTDYSCLVAWLGDQAMRTILAIVPATPGRDLAQHQASGPAARLQPCRAKPPTISKEDKWHAS